MHYIKLGLWIFILSVIYSLGIFNQCGFYPEFLFLFSVLYSEFSKSFREKVTVSLVSGVCMGAFSGYGFPFSVLLILYTTIIFSLFLGKKLWKFKFILIFFVTAFYEYMFGVLFFTPSYKLLYTLILEGLANAVFAFILYPLIKRSFEEKEHYIF